MLDSLEVKVLYPTWWRWMVSEARRRNNTRREAGPERNVGAKMRAMNDQRIRGLRWRAASNWLRSPHLPGSAFRRWSWSF